MNTWNIIMPNKARRPRMPWLSTQARKRSGWETKAMRGLPTNQKTQRSTVAAPRQVRATARFLFCWSQCFIAISLSRPVSSIRDGLQKFINKLLQKTGEFFSFPTKKGPGRWPGPLSVIPR